MISQRKRVTHKNLQVSVELRNEVSLWKVANHGVNRLTVLEEDEGRDGDDAETSCKICLVINVYLVNVKLVCHLMANFLNDWAKSAARTTPGCPEINEDRFVCVSKNRIELCSSKLLCHNEPPVTHGL
jgi:hypothetical protein